MSRLPPQAVEEFQVLWKNRYGVALPPDIAIERANQVFAVLRLVLEKPSSGRSARTDAPASIAEPSEEATADSAEFLA